MIKKGELLKVHKNKYNVVCLVEIGFPYHDEIKQQYKNEMVKDYYEDIVEMTEKKAAFQTLYKNPEFISSIGPLHAQAIDMNFKFNCERIEGLDFFPMLYIQRENTGTSLPHNHLHGGTSISTTFYIDLPESGGEIRFYFGPDDTTTIKPKPNVLYVFPSWLYHTPLPHSGTETRVCVNVDYFTLGRAVFIHEQQKWVKKNMPHIRPASQGWDKTPYSIW